MRGGWAQSSEPFVAMMASRARLLDGVTSGSACGTVCGPTVAVIHSFSLFRGFLGREEHRLYAVGFGRVARRFLPEREARDDRRTHPLEPRVLEQREHLSLRESAADSAGPELGVVDDRLRELFRAYDVGDREPTARPENAEQLTDHGALAEGEVDHAVRNHDVHARIWKRNVFHPPLVARHPHA